MSIYWRRQPPGSYLAPGALAGQRYPGIAAYLRGCGPGREDFEVLLAGVRDAAD